MSKLQTKRELRCYEASEVRAVEDGETRRLIGYAAVFDSPSERLAGWDGEFVERIAPGAFTKTLADKDDVRALKNHDPNLILGRTTAGTLALAQDERGLRAEIMPPDTQTGRDVIEEVRRGDISQMSFAFEVVRQEFKRVQDGPDERILLEVKLFDVSPVTYPAYQDTTVAVRSMQEALAEIGTPTDTLRRRLALESVA